MGGGTTGLTGTSILFIIHCLVVGIISQKLEAYTHIPYTVLLTAWGIICDIVFRDTILDEASSKMEIIDPMILLTLFTGKLSLLCSGIGFCDSYESGMDVHVAGPSRCRFYR